MLLRWMIMLIDDLTALGQKWEKPERIKNYTTGTFWSEPCFWKQIAIEKGKMNPSYLILRALAKVLHISLDTLINPDVSLEDEGVNQMKMLYSSCPPEMRDTLLHHTQETVKELTELSKKFETNWASEWNLTILSLVLFIFGEKRQAMPVLIHTNSAEKKILRDFFRLLVEGSPKLPLNTESHSGLRSGETLWPGSVYRWPWSFSFQHPVLPPFLSTWSTFAFRLKSHSFLFMGACWYSA